MTAQELLKSQIDGVGGQLDRVMDGFDPAKADFKVHEETMSFREHLVHLSEVYEMVQKKAAGESHKWGSYVPPSTDWEPLKSNFKTMRLGAVTAVMADPAHAETGAGFIVGHDNYHVGQMVTTRMAAEPAWNAYSIYGEE